MKKLLNIVLELVMVQSIVQLVFLVTVPALVHVLLQEEVQVQEQEAAAASAVLAAVHTRKFEVDGGGARLLERFACGTPSPSVEHLLYQ